MQTKNQSDAQGITVEAYGNTETDLMEEGEPAL